jgi:hypothetical protein
MNLKSHAKCKHIDVRFLICTHKNVYLCACVYICTNTHTKKHKYIHIYACANEKSYVHVFACDVGHQVYIRYEKNYLLIVLMQP